MKPYLIRFARCLRKEYLVCLDLQAKIRLSLTAKSAYSAIGSFRPDSTLRPS
jgi:hypothetical protein